MMESFEPFVVVVELYFAVVGGGLRLSGVMAFVLILGGVGLVSIVLKILLEVATHALRNLA